GVQLTEHGLVALGLGELEHLGDRRQRLVAAAPVVQRATGTLEARNRLLGLVRTVPEAGRAHARLALPHLGEPGIDVKGTPAAPHRRRSSPVATAAARAAARAR